MLHRWFSKTRWRRTPSNHTTPCLKAELQPSEADHDPMEERKVFWNMSGEFINRDHVMPRGCADRVIVLNSFKYIDVVRRTETNFDNLDAVSGTSVCSEVVHELMVD